MANETFSDTDQVTVLAPNELVVGNRLEFRDCLLRQAGNRHVLVDMKHCKYIDSSALGTLVTVSRDLRKNSKNLGFFDYDEDLGLLFEMTRVGQVIFLSPEQTANLKVLNGVRNFAPAAYNGDADEGESSYPDLKLIQETSRQTVMGRKQRKGGPQLNRDQHHMNLAMASLRSEAAAEALNAARDNLPHDRREAFKTMKQELMTQRIGPVSRWFCLMQLYFTAVHVIVRTWQRAGLSNPDVDAILGEPKMLDMLTDFRDDLMHGGPLLGEEVAVFFDNLESVDGWANRFRQAIDQYVVGYFAKPRR